MSASLLVAGGTDVRTAAEATPTYAHALAAQDRGAAEVMGALLPG